MCISVISEVCIIRRRVTFVHALFKVSPKTVASQDDIITIKRSSRC